MLTFAKGLQWVAANATVGIQNCNRWYTKNVNAKPEYKVEMIQNGIDNNTPKKNLFFALCPREGMLIDKRNTGITTGNEIIRKRAISELFQGE